MTESAQWGQFSELTEEDEILDNLVCNIRKIRNILKKKKCIIKTQRLSSESQCWMSFWTNRKKEMI